MAKTLHGLQIKTADSGKAFCQLNVGDIFRSINYEEIFIKIDKISGFNAVAVTGDSFHFGDRQIVQRASKLELPE